MQIYFDTATFDNVERDKKIKTEAQLSLIGGTMGLLTGFSIISGVEIIFFFFRLSKVIILNFPWCHQKLLIISVQAGQLLQIKGADGVAAIKDYLEKFQNHLM